MDQEEKPPERSSISKVVPDWRPTREQALWAIWITVVVIGVLLLLYGISCFFRIELMTLLRVVAIPITVAVAVPLLNWLQKNRELAIQQLQKERELAVANQRAQDEALQAYLDQMSQLLLDKDRPLLKSAVLRLKQSLKSKTDSEANTSEASTLAKARTLTVLTRLDGTRKRSVVDFLFEARLICRDCKGLGDWPLKEADLREADLFKAHLREADLRHARLRKADLREADLLEADLSGADLDNAKLNKANLKGAVLGTTTDSSEHRADLTNANLEGAIVSDAQLCQCRSLKGATMPNGRKYEDYWLKDKEGRRENSGLS